MFNIIKKSDHLKHFKIIIVALSLIIYTLCVVDNSICEVPKNGLVAEFLFEDNVNDTSGNEKLAEINGNITYSSGIIGQAAVFDGNSWLTLHDFYLPTNTGTVSVWVYVDETAENCACIIDTETHNRSTFIANSKNEDCNALANTFRIGYHLTNHSITKSNWVLLTFTYNNSVGKGFFNGEYVGEYNAPFNSYERPSYAGGFDGSIIGGCVGTTEPNNSLFNGMLDDLRASFISSKN